MIEFYVAKTLFSRCFIFILFYDPSHHSRLSTVIDASLVCKTYTSLGMQLNTYMYPHIRILLHENYKSLM